jgi:hypothetical protein
VRVEACVATAPTPLRTHGTPLPTHGLRVVTATPDSPVRGSIAAIENVWKTSSSPRCHATLPRDRVLRRERAGREQRDADAREPMPNVHAHLLDLKRAWGTTPWGARGGRASRRPRERRGLADADADAGREARG